jgi:hypothetical protein
MRTPIRVRFVAASNESDQVIAESELMPEALPERFDEETRLHLGNETWEVLRAEPPARADWLRTGALTLTLRRVAHPTVAARDILYSLPTLCERLPEVEALPGGGGEPPLLLRMHEDHWRQVELVSRTHTALVHEELAAIERIRRECSGPGFRDVHVRKQPSSPLVDCHVTTAILERALPAAEPFDGVGFEAGQGGAPAGRVTGGFAYASGEVRVYGVSAEGVAMCLALDKAPPTLPAALKGLLADHGLLLVDWCAARVLA